MELVFVHLGKKLPKHLVLNLKRTVRQFPNMKCILVVNDECKLPLIPGVDIHHFHFNELSNDILHELSHPSDFRDNFWAYSLIRLVALHDYICQSGREIIHVESDVVLAKDFPFSKFETLPKGIAFPMVSSAQGIASILYLRSEECSNLILDEIKHQIGDNSATTDMLVLGGVFKRFSRDVQVLPTAPISSLTLLLDNSHSDNFEFGANHFEGYFDGADIGCFLTGHDPRNYKGRRHIRAIIDGNFLNPRKISMTYSTYRGFLNLSELSGNKSYPIFNLHVHSKDLKFFEEKSLRRKLEDRIQNSHSPESSEWSLRALFQVLNFAAMRRIKLMAKKVKNYGTNR